jgi:hypothetical protein
MITPDVACKIEYTRIEAMSDQLGTLLAHFLGRITAELVEETLKSACPMLVVCCETEVSLNCF